MPNRKIHISAPMSLSWSTVLNFISTLKRNGFNTTYWDRHTIYNESSLEKADAMVLLLPKNNFDYKINQLPPGCLKEYKKAVKRGIPVLIGYKDRHGDHNIYFANITADGSRSTIKGVTGTANNFRCINEKIDKMYERTKKYYSYDMETDIEGFIDEYVNAPSPSWKKVSDETKGKIPTKKSVEINCVKGYDKRILLCL